MTKTNQQKVKDFLINNGVIIVMFILVIYTGFTSDNFFTKNNFMNILMNMSSRLVIALGIAGCVITAGCDLSAGRMIGFGACISGMLLQRMDYSGKFFPDMQPLNVFVVALIAMLVCAAFGTVTGFFIAYLNVPPFIATLAMMEIVYGIGLIVTNATPLGGYVEQYTNVSNGKFLGINYLIWIAIIVAAITWFIFNMTRHGKYMYAIGGNPQAAEVAAKREQERQAAAANQNQHINTTVTPAKGDSSVASGVVSLAYSLLGVPYVSGGSSPSGFDCSGFTSYLFRQYGINISRSSSAQAYGGTAVNGLANAQPGDVICFPGHVGLYVGGGQMIHANVPGGSVRLVGVNSIGMSVIAIRRYW